MKLFSLHGGHSTYSHGVGQPEDFVKKAIEVGYRTIGFSEHMPRPKKFRYPGESGPVRGEATFPEYVEIILDLKKQYKKDIEILLGVEADYFPEYEDHIRGYLEKYPFDYCIGSVHFVRGVPIDHNREELNSLIKELKSVPQVYIEYFQNISQMLDMPEIDIVGHLDLIKIFHTGYEDARVDNALLETLQKIQQKNVLIDVNTAGYDKPCEELYPSRPILKVARKMGIEVTLGDDSHEVGHIGRHYKKALHELRKAGYDKVVVLTKKGKEMVREYVEI